MDKFITLILPILELLVKFRKEFGVDKMMVEVLAASEYKVAKIY